MDLEGLAKKLVVSSTFDDDFVDRLNNWWSCMLLIACAIIVSARQYVGVPIKCWFPQEFHKSWKQYGENYCWIKNTYFVPPNEELPKDFDIRSHNELAYYQWVPYVLMCLALLFYIPKAIWRLLNWQTGLNVQTVVSSACDAENLMPEKRASTMRTLAHALTDAITRIEKTENIINRIKQMGSCCVTRAHLGRHLTSLYLSCKLLYVLNLLVQFWMLKSFIGTKYSFFGIRMLADLVNGMEWHDSGHFPRITLCDFGVRALGQEAHNYTVQCVLSINLFNEKVFIIIWFWYAIMFVLSFCSLLKWTLNMLRFSPRISLVRTFLKMALPKNELQPTFTERKLHDFVSHTLQMDGVFLLRLIESNGGDMMAASLAAAMWNDYLEKQGKPSSSGPRSELSENQPDDEAQENFV